MSEARLVVAPIDSRETFKDKAYAALRNVIMSSDIYRSRTDIRLDERQLAQDFGISRTPVREAMAQLEREGFVRSVPRRGIYVVRKTKGEVIEMIQAWAALESMAARLMSSARSRLRNTRSASLSRQGASVKPQLPMTTLVTPCHDEGVTAPSQQICAS